MSTLPFRTLNVFAIGLILPFVLAAPLVPQAAAEGPTPAGLDLELGRSAFQAKCALCHGASGDGKGEIAYLLSPPPRDLTRGVFKFRSTPTGTPPTDEDLRRTIDEGIPGTAMPGWKDELSEAERDALVEVIKGFSDAWEDPEYFDPPLELGPTPEVSPEMVEAGRETYKMMGCAKCHGESGRGDGPSAAELVDNLGRPIRPFDFTRGIRMRRGNRIEDIARTVMTGLDGTPMPGFGTMVPMKQVWELAAFVKSLAKTPPPPATTGVIQAVAVEGAVPLDPRSPLWDRPRRSALRLHPLWSRDDVQDWITVRAMVGEGQLGLLVEWDDSTPDAASGHSQTAFDDACAVQFPLVLSGEKPMYAMGSQDNPVNLWHWKAGLEPRPVQLASAAVPVVDTFQGAQEDPVFRTAVAAGNLVHGPRGAAPVQELNATGPGTLTLQPLSSQDVRGRGVYMDRAWHVVMVRDLTTGDPDDANLAVKRKIPVAFALWDGSKGDRDGQKAVTQWEWLVLP